MSTLIIGKNGQIGESLLNVFKNTDKIIPLGRDELNLAFYLRKLETS